VACLAPIPVSGKNIGRELQQSQLERETAKGAVEHLAQRDVKPEVITIATQ